MFKLITIPNCFIAIVSRCLFIYTYFKNICKKSVVYTNIGCIFVSAIKRNTKTKYYENFNQLPKNNEYLFN